MKRYRSIGLAVLVAVLGGCGGEKKQEGGQSWGSGQGGGRPPGGGAAIPVRVEKVVRGDISAYIQTYERLAAERWVNVVSRAAGVVMELGVEEGDLVREGEVLARLDKEELALRMEQVEVTLVQARTSHERTLSLHQRALVSEEELDAARHQLENAQVGLKEARLNLAYADIRAPLSGVVMLRSVEVGDMVRLNQEVFAVADLEPLLARIRIPEKRMHQIRVGQEARIIIDSLPEHSFTGKVQMISPLVDSQSGTVKVTLEVPATRSLLKPGMFASVQIITEQHSQTLIIPKKALVLETDEDDVFALAEGKARRVRVKLGFSEGDRIEVLEGLVEGDQVITVGQEGLKDGQAVRIAGQEVEGGEFARQDSAALGDASAQAQGTKAWGGGGSGASGGKALPDSATFVKREQEQRGLSESEAIEQWKSMKHRLAQKQSEGD
jgi:membrane fusion protein (multidrug efflux system)